MDIGNPSSSLVLNESHDVALPVDGQRAIFLDVIRCCAVIMVVLFHVAYPPVMNQFGTLGPTQWWIANTLDTFSRPNVPLLVLLSGALLLSPQKTESASLFFRKRARRVLIPLLGWAVLYSLWRVGVRKEPLTLLRALEDLLTGNVYSHLWFLYMILGLYLVTPILRIYVRNASSRNLWYFVGVWFVVTGILPTIYKLFNLTIGIPAFVATTYVGYFVAGQLLRNLTVPKSLRRLLPVLILSLTALAAWASYASTIASGRREVDEYFATVWSPIIIIMTFCVFLFLKELPHERLQERMPIVYQAIRRFSSACLGVYLVHVMVFETLGMGLLGFTLNSMTLPPIIGIPVITMVIVIVSFVIVSFIQRIPLLRAIV